MKRPREIPFPVAIWLAFVFGLLLLNIANQILHLEGVHP